jgi:galactose oxidase
MYESGKILYAGGGGGNPSTGIPPTETAETIDLNGPSPQWVSTGSMTYGRRQMNLTILADGKVLATGGTSSPGFSVRTLARKEAEIWDPATGTWTLMAPEAVIRVYHGVSLLLPDGRVLSAGSGDGKGLPKETTGQIFSPPYLFRLDGGPAARPRISGVSTTALRYGQQFNVLTPNAASIARVNLIRFSSVTHAFNQSQLLYRASFTSINGMLKVTGPASGRLAPPGPYLLFIVNSNGVPSVAKFVSLSN